MSLLDALLLDPARTVGLYAYPSDGFVFFPVFRRLVMRSNTIRLADGRTESVAKTLALVLFWTQNALIEDNVIDLPASNPLRHSNTDKIASVSIAYSNNRSSSGNLIQGVYENSANLLIPQQETATVVEEAFVLAMI